MAMNSFWRSPLVFVFFLLLLSLSWGCVTPGDFAGGPEDDQQVDQDLAQDQDLESDEDATINDVDLTPSDQADGETCDGCEEPTPAYVVDGGEWHTCAIFESGGEYLVKCWGDNHLAQLGQIEEDFPVESSSPRSINHSLNGVPLDLVCGASHCCVATTEESYCWGDSSESRLGKAELPSYQKLAANKGPFNPLTCGLDDNGDWWCWGTNYEDMFGFVDMEPSKDPLRLVPPDSQSFSELAIGDRFICGLSDRGKVFCRGYNDRGQVGHEIENAVHPWNEVSLGGLVVTQIAAGDAHACALTSDDALYCWGNNGKGAVKPGEPYVPTPAPVLVLDGLGEEVVQSLALGLSSTCAILESGQVKCWGINGYGQVGAPSLAPAIQPIHNGEGSPVQVLSLGAGREHFCAYGTDHELLCWGRNSRGQLGNGKKSTWPLPVEIGGQVLSLDGSSEIHLGQRHSCLLNGESVYCWGSNFKKQVAPESAEIFLPIPTPVLGLTASQLEVGFAHNCISAGGVEKIQCWGDNASGQVGDASHLHRWSEFKNDTGTPENIHTVYDLALGVDHSCALVSLEDYPDTAKLYCWGNNESGQSGESSPAPIIEPQPVSTLTTLTLDKITAGSRFTCLVSTNDVNCWGDNSAGQLGDDGTLEDPVLIEANGIVDCRSGLMHSCFKYSTGYQCWGSAGRYSTAATNVSDLWPGYSGTFYLNNGVLVSMGANGSGQLGVGDYKEVAGNEVESADVQFPTVNTSPIMVDGGGAHSCAIVDEDGEHKLYCWGDNGAGQLGVGESVEGLGTDSYWAQAIVTP